MAESADALLHARVVLLREISELEARIERAEWEAQAVAAAAGPHRGRLALPHAPT